MMAFRISVWLGLLNPEDMREVVMVTLVFGCYGGEDWYADECVEILRK